MPKRIKYIFNCHDPKTNIFYYELFHKGKRHKFDTVEEAEEYVEKISH